MTKLKDDIIKLREEGKTYREIQEILNCSKATISYYVGFEQKDKVLARQQQKRNAIKEFIAELKQSNPCLDCGENYPYWMMDFDHMENKEFVISNYRNVTTDFEKIKNEISKCEIVCANCHRNRTFLRKLKNGTGLALDISIMEKYYNR